jgi:hypothetical protein
MEHAFPFASKINTFDDGYRCRIYNVNQWFTAPLHEPTCTCNYRRRAKQDHKHTQAYVYCALVRSNTL